MCLYLFKRKSTYYYRIRIPVDLIEHFNGKALFVKSLKTKDLNSAKVVAARLNSQVQNSFALIRAQGFDLVLPQESQGKSSLNFSKLIKMYITEKSSGWTQRTTDDFTQRLSVLLKLMGDVAVGTINREICVACRDTLSRLPAYFSTKNVYKGKSIKALIGIDAPKLSIKTVNMYIVLLSSVFKWGTKHGYMQKNPAEGLLVADKTQVNEERKAYTKADIKVIFNALPNSPSEMYWIPRIARYSGMRLEEICQLHIADIKTVEGVICFDVNDREGKSLKTSASKRLVPVHKVLLEDLGFMSYVNSVGNPRLWPNLQKDKYGRYGKAFGNRYGKLNRKLISDTKKCFHSYRHTVADSLRQLGVNETLIIELLGHDDLHITTGRYGKRYKPVTLLEALSKL